MYSNMQGGGTEPNIRKLRNFGILQIAIKVAREYWPAILDLSYGSHHELLKMATNQNGKFDVLGIF